MSTRHRTTDGPTYSLILCTLGRTRPLERFLESLAAQTYRRFELIVVDQNDDDRVAEALARVRLDRPVLHLRTRPGLSHARNLALSRVRGEIVAFPDDDCWYAPSLLDRVWQVFCSHPEWDGVTGMAVDERGRPSTSRWSRGSGPLTRYNCWWRAVSFTLFIRWRVVERVGHFDETLGVGAQSPWGSSEEMDYILRALDAGCRIVYSPSLVVGHAHPVERRDDKAIARAYRYGMGVGRVLRVRQLPAWFRVFMAARPAAGVPLSLLRGRPDDARYHWASFRGRVQGLWVRE
ncbi:MAG: glycosyltransferase family 2 protein [Armatimonadota bacterium]|nr:glycosyltransferase family 2 protein [Armatimonadota bacterium]